MRHQHRGPREGYDQRGVDMNSGHIVFDRLWKESRVVSHDRARTMCYVWLAAQMSITREECHFSRLGEDQIKQALAICRRATWSTVYHWHDRNDNAKRAFGAVRKAS